MNTKTTCAAIAAALLSACDSGKTAAANGETPSASATPAKAAEPTSLNRTAHAAGVDFTVTDVATTNHIGPAATKQTVEPGETFVVVSYTMKNTSGKPLTFMERPGLSLVDGKKQIYALDDAATMYAGLLMEDSSGMSSDLNPNVSARTKAVWKVDKASFDKGVWRLILRTDPVQPFLLK